MHILCLVFNIALLALLLIRQNLGTGNSAIFKWKSSNLGNLAIQQSHLMLCEGGRCTVGQETIKQEQQCKTMEQKQRANYYFKSSINQQQQQQQ